MVEKLPHPTSQADPARARADFITVKQTRCADPAWHFKIGVHKSSKLGPEGADQPTPDAPTQSLGLFHRDAPPSDVEVMGVLMPWEIDPQYWLEEALKLESKDIVSSKSVMMRGGLFGDVVATWHEGGADYAGRFVASKWGPRIYFLNMRASLGDYPKVADDFFISVMTFQALDETFGHLAEKVYTVESKVPLTWKVAVPASWLVQPAPEAQKVSSFQAAQIPIQEQDDDEKLLGKLSFAVVARSAVRVPRAAATAFLEVLKENEFELEDKDFEEEASRPPFHKSWVLVCGATRKGRASEVRCRVMLHERAWVIAGVVGSKREDDAFAWMRNQRVLDVVTSTLVIRP
ncbi:MAG TPA: hypothetical protein VH560_12305 [Polyangia bacterium]|nr:hypothetical protein [Polyangia bacterium]